MASSRTMRRAAALFASLGLLASIVGPVIAAEKIRGFSVADSRITATGRIEGDLSKAFEKNGKLSVIVRLAGAPVASYRGGIKGLPATSPSAKHTSHIDFTSKATTDYRAYLKNNLGK